MDNVYISPDHLPWLQSRFETVMLDTSLGKIPYLPLARVPYYVWVGRKSLSEKGSAPGQVFH
jgi:S-adenosylmethionine-diacylgycerolhomoserine-N-methlytransferase